MVVRLAVSARWPGCEVELSMRYAWLLILLAGCDMRDPTVRYCEERGIPYRQGTAADAPRVYETRSEQAARLNELGDKLRPTEAETREYLRLSVEFSAE